MLCRRHNNALSPLDKMAAEFFRYSVEDHLDVFRYLGNDDRDSFPRGFTMVSGPYFELWMLKVLWGAVEAGALGARMTGGGFGGCVVALLRPEKVAEVIAAVEAEYPTVSGLKADCYVCRSTDGACRN